MVGRLFRVRHNSCLPLPTSKIILCPKLPVCLYNFKMKGECGSHSATWQCNSEAMVKVGGVWFGGKLDNLISKRNS